MAATRERRTNAGSKMSKLMEDEEEDEFYATTYGGFGEAEDDGEFVAKSDDEDIVDSDFSIDENDELRSDDDEDQPKKKKRGIDTKAYKEPVKSKGDSVSAPKHKKPKIKRDSTSRVQIYSSGYRSKRSSTVEKSKEMQEREKARMTKEKEKMLKDIAARKNLAAVRRLTQEELLAEAKITERVNIKALENYEKLQLERKKVRLQKPSQTVPMIRYHSLAMPVLPAEDEPDITTISSEKRIEQEVKDNDKCSRTFLTFSDDKAFKDYFNIPKRRPPTRLICPITRQKARYIDPITKTPFATIRAFRCLREALRQQLATKSDAATIVIEQKSTRSPGSSQVK
ncbi:vacuolar protein sorting-associated protein 72 homolog [Watersipora subatra]|uniref:vacuolar protein sorting-associated protein 72 homolog n=1 Tax=Watersipora subatra TaxID=2589382 RepID=UPI00355BF391